MRHVLIALLIVLAIASVLPPITLTVRPSTALAPGSFELRIHVAPNTANRFLSWWCAGDDFETSESEVRLDGEDAPTLYTRRMLDLPAGDYRCVAILTRINNQRLTATTTFSVH